jgi:anti-sigma factor (TIGR02949 family)
MSLACQDKEPLLHAFADGELDAGNALAIEAHVAGCPGCAETLETIRAVKAQLRRAELRYAAPASLRARVEEALAAEVPNRPQRRRFGAETWIMSGAIGALAAGFAALALIPTGATLESQLIDAQARSLEAQHLVDVATSDRHTVKPWFNGKVDFAPPVVDLASQGYPLVGGRLDRIDGRRAAALVFRRGPHVINLFIWPGEAPAGPTLERKEGYNLVRWGQGGLTLWAVSDCDPGALQGFQKAFAAATG